MPIDFMSMINNPVSPKEQNPLKIYNLLDRNSTTSELRKSQIYILDKWFNTRKNDRDLVIKLNTGAGKTLIGLLILQSKINQTNKSCLYVCPNKYLADQVRKEASKFGIKYCDIGEDNSFPSSFLNGEKILITHIQKLFNGKSIFGIKSRSLDIESIILDDSHACIDSIRDSYCIRITKKNNSKLYNQILNLFESSIKSQGEGTYLNIINDESNDYTQVPYWDLISNIEQFTKTLNHHHTDNELVFKWDILKDNIDKCSVFLNSKVIEIVPTYIDIDIFRSFSYAQNRILMSATTQDDSFFINGLNLDKDSIKNPLCIDNETWFGEKMILIPSLLDEAYKRETFLNLFSKEKSLSFGVVALTPSFLISNIYEEKGFKKIESENINDAIYSIKSIPIPEGYKKLVFSNRYDGIDLPDSACRVLILDSLPYFNNLHEDYEYLNRRKNTFISRMIAQKIEQGMGRAVRGDKDYCIVIILGSDLIQFIKTTNNKNLFSAQTRKQIDISFEMLDVIKTQNNSHSNTIELMKKSLSRDEGWKSFYTARMDEVSSDEKENNLINCNLDTLELEKTSEKNYYFGFFDEAIKNIDSLIDNSNNPEDKAWYLERKARYKFHIDKHNSNEIQIEAFKLNNSLLKPKENIRYEKLNYMNEERVTSINNYIKRFNEYLNLKLHLDVLLDNLSFGKNSQTFESALDEIGILLGFQTQRPDNLLRKGPDNLWVLNTNDYIFFECKNEVKLTRSFISKDEAGQMDNHCGWFDEEYPNSNVKRILIIPTRQLHKDANFTHEVSIMIKTDLERFKARISDFIISLKELDIRNISNITLNDKLNHNSLSIQDIKDNFSAYYER